MNKKTIALIVIGVIFAGAVGFGGYKFYKFQIKMRNNIYVINEFLNTSFPTQVEGYVSAKLGVKPKQVIAPAPTATPLPATNPATQ